MLYALLWHIPKNKYMKSVIIYNLNKFVHVAPEAVAGCYSIKKIVLFNKIHRNVENYVSFSEQNLQNSRKYTLYFGGVFRIQSNIYDGTFCESLQIKAVNQFRKKVPLYKFDRVLHSPLHLKSHITVGTYLQMQILQVRYYTNLSRNMF